MVEWAAMVGNWVGFALNSSRDFDSLIQDFTIFIIDEEKNSYQVAKKVSKRSGA